MKKITSGILISVAFILPTILFFKSYSLDFKRQSQSTSKIDTSSLNKAGDIRLFENLKSVTNIPQGNFYYAGDISFAALSSAGLDEKLSRIYSNFKLSYREPLSSPPGSTAGIQMLLDKRISFAHSNRYLTEQEIFSAKLKGYQLEQIAVAVDGLSFFVHNLSSIKSLSKRQLRAIYEGRITNWQQVGGPNLPITPVGLEPKVDNSLQLLYRTDSKTTNYQNLSDNLVLVRDYTSAIRKTNSMPGAISYASSAIIQKQNSVKPIAIAEDNSSPAISAILSDGTINLNAFQKKIYPLTRYLYVVIPRDKQRTSVGVAYANLLLSNEGQEILRQAGFSPLGRHLKQNKE